MPYELPPMRPPSEAYSLLIRVERGCPWNRCTFCDAYKDMKFDRSAIRSVDEVKEDIRTARRILDRAQEVSRSLGSGGQINEAVRAYLIRTSWLDISALPWLMRYGEPRTAFIGDSNAIVLKAEPLIEIIQFMFQAFPSLERLTSYGRAKTVVSKSPPELLALRQAGLSRLHLGLETGDDELLALVKKGATSAEMIAAGRTVKAAGISLCEYVMPGLGGREKSQQHALNTARVLNQTDPDFVRMRSFVPRRGTPLFEQYEAGQLELLSPHGYVQEIKLLVENLEVHSRVCFDHIINPCYRAGNHLVPLLHPDENGYQFPEQRAEVLQRLGEGLSMTESCFIRAEQWMWREHL